MNIFVKLGQDIVSLWKEYAGLYLNGVWNTVSLAVLCTAVGCLIGLLCGILNTIPYTKNDNIFKRILLRTIRIVNQIYVEVFRGTPMILQAVVIYYGLPYFTNYAVRFSSVWLCAFVVVSVNTGAYMAESVRGGIISIDPGQTEGAKAVGMTHWQTMTNVILPQALRNILPQIGNNLIINIKDTSVMSIIGFTEFFAIHKSVAGTTYQYFPSAAIEMVGYLSMTLIASFLLRLWEKKMDGASSYELVQVDSLTMTAGTYSHPDKGSPFDEKSKEFRNAKELKRERRERKLQELRYGRPKGDR
ncbi:MAG: amino acid ABC transporter permease [Oscillospiraceae bacterium]|nr:amino acid ABC transporter permease [Oscillospiraceae bacterium]